MKLLLDQDVYAVTANLLASSGHEVALASQLGLSRVADEKILRTSHSQGRILLTRDRDFGNLVFVAGLEAGVIYLRILPSTVNAVHRELQNVLESYSEQELLAAFVVVEAGGHRIRRSKR